MTESELHRLVARHIHGGCDRFENLISAGIFDSNLYYNNREAWVEYKISHNGIMYVRGSQYVWGTRRLQQGMTNMFFLVANPAAQLMLFKAVDVFEICHLENTDKAGSFMTDIKPLASLLQHSTGPRMWEEANEALFMG